uniref:C2H2-type domain-containing protein n=1 Tax=Eptatretus burgeri TaxID=7764 RepID=A0A8C4Q077_EPTBU
MEMAPEDRYNSCPFAAWLLSEGLTAETSRAIVKELGIESLGMFRACAEPAPVRAELFTLAKQKLPFAVYAEIRHFVEAHCVSTGKGLNTAFTDQVTSPTLVAVLCSMLNSMSHELFSCAQKLHCLIAIPESDGEECSRMEDIEVAQEVGTTIIQNLCTKQENDSEIARVMLPLNRCEENFTTNLPGSIDTDSEESNHPQASAGSSRDIETYLQEGRNHDIYTDEWGEHSDENRLPKEVETEQEPVDFISLQGDVMIPVTAGLFQPTTHSVSQEASGQASGKKKNGVRMHQCTICNRQFLTETALHLHVDKHPVKISHRRHKCNQCPYSSDHKGNLNKHVRTHTGERPYKCIVCGRAFAQSTTCQRHLNTHVDSSYAMDPHSLTPLLVQRSTS